MVNNIQGECMTTSLRCVNYRKCGIRIALEQLHDRDFLGLCISDGPQMNEWFKTRGMRVAIELIYNRDILVDCNSG